LFNLRKFPVYLSSFIQKEKLIILIDFHKEKYKEDSLEYVEVDQKKDIFYRFKNTYEIPSELIKIMFDLYNFSVNNHMNLEAIIKDYSDVISANEKPEKNMIIATQTSAFYHSQKIEYETNKYFESMLSQMENKMGVVDEDDKDDSILIEDERVDQELSLKERFILEQFDLIVYNALNKNEFLFQSDELNSLTSYISLIPSCKLLMINHYLRVKFWVKAKMEKETYQLLQSKGLLHDYNILFEGDKKIKNNNDLFTFLYSLTNDELKIIKKELKHLNKSKTKEDTDVSSQISSCLVNNPFFQIFVENPVLRRKCEECSKIITNHNLTKKMNNNNSSEGNNKGNFKYISKYLKATQLRKIKLTSLDVKVQTTLGIINEINKYLNDKSSMFFDRFLLTQTKSKISTVKKFFKQHFSDFFILDKCFERAFDIASKLFFFFSGEFKSVACLSKEYLGFAIFEKYENYLANSLNNEEFKDYLLPIFSHFDDLRQFYSLYQIKHSTIINLKMIPSYSPIDVLIINYKIFEVLAEFLLKISLRKNDKMNVIIWTEFESMLKNEDFTEIIEKIYLIFVENDGFINDVKEDFIVKFTSEHLAVEILTIFAQIIEKINKKNLAIFLFLILLSSGLNYRKRGYYWHRLILLLKQRDLEKYHKMVKIAEKDRFVKTEYKVKIEKHKKKLKEDQETSLKLKEISNFKDVSIKVIHSFLI
jgi:hypothetical protein